MSKSESNINVTYKFQPMPKRFKMWHKAEKGWYCPAEDSDGIFDINDIPNLTIAVQMYLSIPDGWNIVQSTNLFDNDNKEIFEGSLIQTDTDGVGYVYLSDEGIWCVEFPSEIYSLDNILYDPSAKLSGHILSNPELLEEGE